MEKDSLVKYKGGLVQFIGNAVKITNKLLLADLRQLKILYLDDHTVAPGEITKCILEKYPNATIERIYNGDSALEYVVDCLTNMKELDLIITDHAHPGLNGMDFAKAVRINEMDSGKIIPILFITMFSSESFIQRVEEIPLTKCLPKSAWGEEIKFAINNLI